MSSQNLLHKKNIIIIYCLGKVSHSFMKQTLNEKLESVFSSSCHFKKGFEKLDFAYISSRKQYAAPLILRKLGEFKEWGKILAIMDVDIFAPQLNFIFGEAELNGKYAIISTARLKQEFYGFPPDEKLFKERIQKEAMHELGHTFGLLHCPSPECVMHFSNSLKDTDLKQAKFCKYCQKNWKN